MARGSAKRNGCYDDVVGVLGASLSTSSRLGIGKVEQFAYDIYEVEFLPEVLFGSTYRRSLTSVPPFPPRYGQTSFRRYPSVFPRCFRFRFEHRRVFTQADRAVCLFWCSDVLRGRNQPRTGGYSSVPDRTQQRGSIWGDKRFEELLKLNSIHVGRTFVGTGLPLMP